MLDRKLRLSLVDNALIMAALCAATPLMVFAQDDLSTELRRCSVIDEGAARLECYDALSGRKSPTASESAEVQQKVAAHPVPKSLDEEAVDRATPAQAAVRKDLLNEKAADQKAGEAEVPVDSIADKKTLDDLG